MSFYEDQDRARRKSHLLVLVFVAAIVCILGAMDLAAMGLWLFVHMYMDTTSFRPPALLHGIVIGATLAVLAFISIRKTLQVHQGGGMAVARMMGARQVVPVKASPLEHRLLNVVEEIAIAAQRPVPIVFVMDEYGGINSFAAGFDRGLNVIVVTRGALERLNRAELQGVIAHEFSHIVNGDMAFNLYMIGPLAGLVYIGAAGEHVLRAMVQAEEMDIRAAPLIAFAGIALFTIGYTGVVFGRIIKAMIAREREYLADAGAVQFTRDPTGLAGALDQVRQGHSTILHVNVESVSHLFFAEAMYLEEERVLSTHPPLHDRIVKLSSSYSLEEYRKRRVDPLTELERSMAAPVPRMVSGTDHVPDTA